MSTSSVSNALATPLTSLTGSSSFSTDLQNSVNRALQIASLPMQLLQSSQAQTAGQISELSQLGSLFSNLQNSIQSLASGAGSNAMAATVSDTSVLQTTLTGGALPGTYSVQVSDAGAEASAMSIALPTPVTDPSGQSLSQSSVYTLTVNGTTYTIQPPAQTLNGLAASINASGAPVTAVVVNVGTSASPDYRLVVQSTNLGVVPIQLSYTANNVTTNLLSPLAAGRNGSYTVDNQPPGGISTTTSTVTIAPGLNVTLQNTGSTNITVAPSLNTVSSALSSFVSTFNAAVAEVQKNFGKGGGALAADSSVQSMQQALNQLASYTGSSGSITSLSQLGIEFTQQGTLTFNQSTLSNLSSSQVNDALSFLGDPNAGGFLQYATNTLTAISDPISGVIASETQTLQNRNLQDQQQINTDQDRLNQLQRNLQAQMAAANALIATMQQQTQFLQGMFQYATSNNPFAGTAG
jgi:flagellar hook-associated protein 2